MRKIQAPRTRNPLKPQPLVLAMVDHLTLVRDARRIHKLPIKRLRELAHRIWLILRIPLIRAMDAFEEGIGLIFWHVQELVYEFLVGAGVLVPASETLVCRFQQREVVFRHLWRHGVEGPVVPIVAFDDQTEDLFVQAHCFAVVPGRGVDLGQQVRHLECLGVERAPEAAEVVADVFAQVDGFGAVAAKEAGLHKALADGNDDV